MWKVLLIISMMVGGAVSASNDDEPFASNLFSDLAPYDFPPFVIDWSLTCISADNYQNSCSVWRGTC
jgi:hypothetical protein